MEYITDMIVIDQMKYKDKEPTYKSSSLASFSDFRISWRSLDSV